MDKIDGSFTIDVNGKPVTSIQGTDTESFTPASVGGEPAVFTLTDGRLVSGDWYLGRYLVEAKSLAPKPVMWFKKEDTSPDAIYPCQASQSGGSCELLLDHSPLKEIDGKLFALLVDRDGCKAEIKMW